MNNQLCIPQKIYDAYIFFEKTKDESWTENPFVFFKKIHGVPVKIAKNISNLNYYQVDLQVNKNINPSYLIKYLKEIDYRNYYSSESILFKEIKRENKNLWVEIENYQGVDIKYIVNYDETQFYLLFYNNNWFPENINTSQTKYYHSFKILNSENEYILRFEIILNNMDIDQIIDIQIYLEMLINILRAIYKKFNIIFKLDHSLELETKKYLELRKRKKN
jgi:hypothetical protein